MSASYKPRPLDTTHIRLPQELLDLTEKLALNTHELWASMRRDEGWTYGPVRDGLTKTTPTMVPYDELPESERDYDRTIAMETLKLVLALGYELRKQEDGEAPSP